MDLRAALISGDRKELDALVSAIYEELRRMARQQRRLQRRGTLQTTALIHEAYLRLAGKTSLRIESREHFLNIAAQLMRWILVDDERRKRAGKRGANRQSVTLTNDVSIPEGDADSGVDVVALDQALNKLSELDAEQSRIVELRYFGGLSIADTAALLGISPATVKRSWASARAWLKRELERTADQV